MEDGDFTQKHLGRRTFLKGTAGAMVGMAGLVAGIFLGAVAAVTFGLLGRRRAGKLAIGQGTCQLER